MLSIQDFKWSLKGVLVKETGVFISFNLDLIKDILKWLKYYKAEKQSHRITERPIRKITCHPRNVQPFYLLWGVLHQAGLVPTEHNNKANIHLYFSDQTYLNTLDTAPAGINRDCINISKSHVAKIFERIFGYSLSVDPRIATPPFVCKSELNGRHDGYITFENCEPKHGWVYQKLIKTETKEGTVLDLRCPTVFGEIPLMYLKERPIEKRFANMNSRCRIADPDEFLSKEERSLISKFCAEMKLDWGGLDILRDANDRKIYIVDVNKTDMAPLVLPLKEKLRSTRILGKALREAVDKHYPLKQI